MLPFVFLLLVPILIQHIEIKTIDYQKKNKFAITLFFVLLTILVMFRHESVGTDTENYINIYSYISRLDWSNINVGASEFGFSVLCKMISIFSLEPRLFLVVVAVVVFSVILPTYCRLCLDSSLTIVLFCTMSTFVMMFSGIRQMIAIGIGFIAYEFTREKKFFCFLISVIVAISFHSSALMLLFMYHLYHARITKKWLYIVIPVMSIVFIYNKPIFSTLTLILEKYSRFEGSVTSTGAYTMLILFVLFAVFAFLIPDEEQIDDETIGMRNFLLLSIIVQMFAPLHSLAMRMNYYYIIFIPLLMPKIIHFRNERWEQVAIAGRHIMVVFFLGYFFINAYSGGALKVFPYHFFWENVV